MWTTLLVCALPSQEPSSLSPDSSILGGACAKYESKQCCACKEAACQDEAAAGGTCSSAAEGIDACCKAMKQGCMDEAAAGCTCAS